MKKTSIILFLLLNNCLLFAQSPKREMRATWIATVGGIDWPKSSVAETQKSEMIKMLDSIQSLNMNTVFFQVRSRCDAMYNSAYEPWSSDLKIVRGTTPGYDPLAFVVDECHKRGLECHAWLNPYRYNNLGTGWTGSNNHASNYENTHPEWLLYYSQDIILDPAIPEVRFRIKSIAGDILSKYDVDGIIFDDYFYPYGGTTNQDAASQAQYTPDGMDVHDWRRNNINRMVADVYDTIQAVKPWVTFGISPFGIWTTNQSVAAEEGIALPSGITGGNMYQEIYCDPVAWLKEGTVDYISPQLYWKTGGGQDYAKLCPWWANLANRFGKQFYSSMAIYKYAEKTDAAYTVSELALQAGYNRSSSKDDAPGHVFYNTLGWVYDKPFRDEFKANVFTYPALPPAIHWKSAPDQEPGCFTGVSAGIVSWTHNGDENVRYAVYGVPIARRNDPGVFSKSQYLIGFSYAKQFRLPAGISTSSHKIAVSVIDRYGNEYAPRVLGENPAEAMAATLTYPAPNANISLGGVFQWQSVSGADCYVWQLSRNAQFTDLVCSMETTGTQYNSALQMSIKNDAAYYWRVKTRKANTSDTWSEVRRFTIGNVSAVEDITTGSFRAWTFYEGGDWYVKLHAEEAALANIMVYAVNGQRLTTTYNYLLAREKLYHLQLDTMNKGIYLVRIQAGTENMTLKLLK
jgi:uncharacterized lipoprotein YddW (UPF0748 family)